LWRSHADATKNLKTTFNATIRFEPQNKISDNLSDQVDYLGLVVADEAANYATAAASTPDDINLALSQNQIV